MVSYPCLFVAPPRPIFYILLYPEIGILYFANCSLSVFCVAILHSIISSLGISWDIHFRQKIANIHQKKVHLAKIRQKISTFADTKISIIFVLCKLLGYG